jgi:hypothetical protein
VQEADLYFDGGFFSDYQTLGLHKPRVVAPLRLAVGARVDAAKGPAFLVLLGRAAVWPEYVAFVEHGGGDLLYRVRQRSTSLSAVFSKLSIVLSQVNSALRDL